ncbi:MurR/RpiR family transcriptional regulator [Vagococcus coleopterorum]|uniref:MurR/RpiR family transcriptional regulator n=1 Tax=Vagococcus coleopterorum TaxID=2714946 RepID=A0A6G8ALM1_9ENTE|nr:MurR/RpiR family transcriptional regulator [Vagococcus coleopterorum]QIL45823.1 MurR/RpiR family transcriptional regulator [Vagococcus coleopterorum]
MHNNILLEIKNYYTNFSKSEKKIADWILKYPSDVLKLSVTDLAKKTETSSATLVRFCYRLDLDGFSDLKINLSNCLATQTTDLHTDILVDEPIDTIKKKLAYKINFAFEETNIKLDNEAINEAIRHIESARMIYTYGIGASAIVAQDISQKLGRSGKNVSYTDNSHLLATSLATNEQADIIFLISHSGMKQEVIKLAAIAKENNITVLSMTSDKDSPLAKESDILLLTADSNEPVLRSSASNSLLTQLFAIDILFSTYASRHYNSMIKKISDSKKAIQSLN